MSTTNQHLRNILTPIILGAYILYILYILYLQTLLLISGTVSLCRDLHFLYGYKNFTVSPSGTILCVLLFNSYFIYAHMVLARAKCFFWPSGVMRGPSLCAGQRHSPESNFYEEPPVVLSGIFDPVSEAIVAAMAKAERQAEWQSSWPPTYRRDWSNQQYFPLEILRSLPC